MKHLFYLLFCFALVSCKKNGTGSGYTSSDALSKGVVKAFKQQNLEKIKSMFPDKEVYREVVSLSPEIKTPDAVEAMVTAYDNFYPQIIEALDEQFKSDAHQSIDWAAAEYEGMIDEEEISKPDVPEIIKLKCSAVFKTDSGRYAIPVDAFVYKNNWYLNKVGSTSAL